jgi:RimJ/RimL family protein N-acetyltransferase
VEQGVSFVLESSRLRLREFVPQDVDALAAVLGDPVTMQYYPAAFDRKGVQEWIERNRNRYRGEGFGLWTNEVIGDCGCFLRDVDGRDDIEIGYHVRRDLWVTAMPRKPPRRACSTRLQSWVLTA